MTHNGARAGGHVVQIRYYSTTLPTRYLPTYYSSCNCISLYLYTLGSSITKQDDIWLQDAALRASKFRCL